MNDRGKILKRHEKRPQPTSLSTQMTMPLPDQPIGIGDSWSTPLDIDVILKDGAHEENPDAAEVHARKGGQRRGHDRGRHADPHADQRSGDRGAVDPAAVDRQRAVRHRGRPRDLNQQLDLDRHVIGFSGPSSSMHYVTRFTEQLLDEPRAGGGQARRAKERAKTPPVKKAAPARR